MFPENNPELCLFRGCPIVQICMENKAQVEKRATEIEGTAFDGTIDNHDAPELFKSLPDGALTMDPTGNLIAVESPEDVAIAMRLTLSGILEMLDRKKETYDNFANQLSERCDGPLKMRAVRNGAEITTTVCMSPTAPDGQQLEDVTIRRKTL